MYVSIYIYMVFNSCYSKVDDVTLGKCSLRTLDSCSLREHRADLLCERPEQQPHHELRRNRGRVSTRSVPLHG